MNFLPNLGLAAWPFWVLTSGIGEETGWRGFALPRLQRKHGALTATLILSVFWVGWHVPQFFYLPTLAAIGISGFAGFAFSIAAGAILFTWLFNSTRGSILAVVLWHGGFNFITASKAGAGTAVMNMSILVMVWASVIVVALGWGRLARVERQPHKGSDI